MDAKVQKEIIESSTNFFRINSKVDITVIIVTHDSPQELKECLDSLLRQRRVKIKIILINNGRHINFDLSRYPLEYFHLRRNYRPSTARNLGAFFSNTELIAFLDDDAVALPDWTVNILEAFKNSKIVAIRGKIVPKERLNPFNLLAYHYDLGKIQLEATIDLEGNCAFRRSEFLSAGGFKDNLYGHEGVDLSQTIRSLSHNKLIKYIPNVVIKHDYSGSIWHYVYKKFRQGRNNRFAIANEIMISRSESVTLNRSSVEKLFIFTFEWIGTISESVGALFPRLN